MNKSQGKVLVFDLTRMRCSTNYSAVDGDTNGVYAEGSTTHTDPSETSPWWKVTLQRPSYIESISVSLILFKLPNLLTILILDEKLKM